MVAWYFEKPIADKAATPAVSMKIGLSLNFLATLFLILLLSKVASNGLTVIVGKAKSVLHN